MSLETGVTGTVVHVVAAADTAQALGSGTVPVLGTPKVVALAEQASVLALDGLPDGRTTVGMKVSLDHVAPTPVGGTVTVTATLDKVEGRRYVMSISASDERGLVAAGFVTRVLVDVHDFLARAGA